MDLFKLGKDKDTGKIVDVSEVKSGLDCNCVCPNCGKDLVAAQGEKTEWYFRHHESTDCHTGPEKGIQELAKEILTKKSRIKLPSLGSIKYSSATADKKVKNLNFNPDVSAKTNGVPLFFDIKVTKENNANINTYQNGKHKSVEIDLSDYVYTSKDEFRKDLLNNSSNKEIIYWKEEKFNTAQTVIALLGTGIALGILALSGRKKTPQKPVSTTQKLLDNSKDLLKNPKEILKQKEALKDFSKNLLDKYRH